jgi:hypothetical protein
VAASDEHRAATGQAHEASAGRGEPEDLAPVPGRFQSASRRGMHLCKLEHRRSASCADLALYGMAGMLTAATLLPEAPSAPLGHPGTQSPRAHVVDGHRQQPAHPLGL